MTDESDKKDKIAKLKLRRIIRDLSKKRARHTEFISVYVPTGYNIQGIIDQISSELGTARNIKTTSTRKNVTGALEKMLQTLRLYKKTPEHGLAIFTGNISEREGQTDIQVWEIEPSEDLRVKMYKCDQVFYLEPLMEQLETKIVYGLLVMDRREANLALLKGKHIIPLMKLDSMVPGKFRVGGQSAQRFARTIEGMAKDWYKKIGDKAVESFKPNEIAGLIVGGPGPTKEDFLKEVKKITEGRGVDIVVEHTGAQTWEKSILSAKWGGTIVTCGATSGDFGKTDLRHVYFRQLQILGSTMGSKGALFEIIRHIESGHLKPVLDEVLPLKEAARAHQKMESRQQFGKIVLVP